MQSTRSTWVSLHYSLCAEADSRWDIERSAMVWQFLMYANVGIKSCRENLFVWTKLTNASHILHCRDSALWPLTHVCNGAWTTSVHRPSVSWARPRKVTGSNSPGQKNQSGDDPFANVECSRLRCTCEVEGEGCVEGLCPSPTSGSGTEPHKFFEIDVWANGVLGIFPCLRKRLTICGCQVQGRDSCYCLWTLCHMTLTAQCELIIVKCCSVLPFQDTPLVKSCGVWTPRHLWIAAYVHSPLVHQGSLEVAI